MEDTHQYRARSRQGCLRIVPNIIHDQRRHPNLVAIRSPLGENTSYRFQWGQSTITFSERGQYIYHGKYQSYTYFRCWSEFLHLAEDRDDPMGYGIWGFGVWTPSENDEAHSRIQLPQLSERWSSDALKGRFRLVV